MGCTVVLVNTSFQDCPDALYHSLRTLRDHFGVPHAHLDIIIWQLAASYTFITTIPEAEHELAAAMTTLKIEESDIPQLDGKTAIITGMIYVCVQFPPG